MTCCLNPACHNPAHPDSTMFCTNCGTGLVMLRNRYRPIKSLGGGGFGKTYLAEDIDKLNENCVIKQFAPQVQGTAALNKATELFDQEAKRLQQLGKHPQIPTLLAYFEQDHRLYLVQEFIEGQNLLQELQQQGNFTEQKVRELLLDLLEILKTVHQHKVIHRDIKLENIIRQIDGKLVLIDFGASKQLTATVITQVGTTIGSFGYAPLEQMQGGEAYPASDLYSVGVTCFHLLSGIHPWELWKRQGYGWVANWRSHLSKPVSQELGRILDKLLQEEYQQRYQSIEQVLQDLNSPLQPSAIPPTQAVTAIPSSPPSAIPPTQAVTVSPSSPPSAIPPAQAVKATPLSPPSAIPPAQAVKATPLSPPQPVTVPSAPEISTPPVKPNVPPQKLFSPNIKFSIKKLIVAGAIALPASQIYGYIRYGWFPTSPIFLLQALPSSIYLERTLTGNDTFVKSLAISPDGKTLVGDPHLYGIILWNLATGEFFDTRSEEAYNYVHLFVISPDGKTLVNRLRSGSDIKLSNLARGQEIRILRGHSGIVSSLAISPDGKTLASGSDDGSIKLWNLATGQQIRTLSGHVNTVNSVAISPDGKTLASGSEGGGIILWNLATGKQIRTLTQSLGLVRFLAISSDGKTLVSGSDQDPIILWNLATGEQSRSLIGYTNGVNSVAISPDGKILAYASRGNTIKLWNLATGQEIRTLIGHSQRITSLAISLDGKTLVSRSDDRTIKIWQLN